MWTLLEGILPTACPCGHRSAPGCALCDLCVAGTVPPPPAHPPPGVDGWAAPFAYAGAVREVVARAKYRQHRAAVPWLARAMVAAHHAAGAAPPDLVTWAPTTRARRRERGFDHAALLARAVARHLAVPAPALLTRLDDRPQTGARRTMRLAGPAVVARRRVPGASVLVVDDVATTGTTLAAAARALRAAGADRVEALTVARTPHPGRVPARWAEPG